MLIGIVGAPNKGKSTLFSAITQNQVAIADYPFTTIKPNLGIGYVTKPCVEQQLGVKCNPRNSLCSNGTRMLPVNIIDVAGLVEGAHKGKGMGNQFLGDIAAADGLIIVADLSGNTDANGNPCNGCDPAADVQTVRNELTEWLTGIIKSHMQKLSASQNGVEALQSVLSGLKVSKLDIEQAITQLSLTSVKINWSESEIRKFSTHVLSASKKTIIAANKADMVKDNNALRLLQSQFGPASVIACCAAVELALRRAAKNNIISYDPANSGIGFKLLAEQLPAEIKSALEYSKKVIEKNNGTNVQTLLNTMVFGSMGQIVVYPVEDENKYTDNFGHVLPDAVLMPKGSTAYQLAATIHTQLAKGMLYGINAKTKTRIKKEYLLQDGDVIKIVSASK